MRAAVLFIFLCALGRTAALADDRSFDAIQPHEQTADEKLLREHPGSARAHLAYAEFLAGNGKLRAAIVQWQTAQAIDPANAAIANSLGGAYLRMGRAAESADQFAGAVGIESNNAAYHYNLANVEFMLRRDLTVAWHMEPAELLRRALAEFRAASRLSPNDLEYARAYAETFCGLPDPDWPEAEVAWKHVLELSPQRDFAYLQLARVSLKRGDKAQAEFFLDQINNTEHDPAEAEVARAGRQVVRGSSDCDVARTSVLRSADGHGSGLHPRALGVCAASVDLPKAGDKFSTHDSSY